MYAAAVEGLYGSAEGGARRTIGIFSFTSVVFNERLETGLYKQFPCVFG
jgi:hypothetical protein